MNLYDINQAAYAKCSKMTKSEINEAKEKVLEYLKACDGRYYLILNPDCRYFTVYTFKDNKDYETMVDDMFDLVKKLGPLKGVEITDNMVEFWVMYEGVCTMFGMFQYDKGVIEI